MALKRVSVSALVLLVAACGTGVPPHRTYTPKPRPSKTSAAPLPVLPTSPAPTGSPVRGAGSPKGLDQDTRTVVRAEAGVVDPRAGDLADLDGDGAADVIATGGRDGKPALYVLKGPFTREGRPAGLEEVPAPIDLEYGDLVADRYPTSMILYGDNDGEQATGWLVPAGRGGLGEDARQLNTGSAAAFGDFDGDGDDEVVFYAGFGPVDLWVADRSKVLAAFDRTRWIPGS